MRGCRALAICLGVLVNTQLWAVPLDIQLPEIEVKDARTDLGVYLPSVSTAATRFEAETLEVPQSVQAFGAQFIEDAGVMEMRDILRHVPSAFSGHTRLAPFTSFSWKIRGFDASSTRNGFRQLYFEDVDQSAFTNVERVEIVKGPGSVTFGKEGLGGVIHMVTKRPLKEFAGSAHVTVGKYDTRIGGFDVTGPVGASGLGIRLNGEIERSGTFTDFQDMDRDNLALTATWDQGGAVRAFFMAEYQRRETLPNPGLPVRGTVLSNGVGRVPRDAYLGEPRVDYLQTWSPLIQAWLEFDLAENWTISPRFQHFEFNVNQQQMRLRAPGAGSLVNRVGRYNFHERDETDTFQLELKGKFRLGETSHQTVLGYERNAHEYKGDWFNYAVVPAIDALAPTYLAVPPALGAYITFSGSIDTDEVYLQDLVKIGDKLDVLIGARHVNIRMDSEFSGVLTKGQDDISTTYQLGASYRFAPAWSLFAGVGTAISVDNIVGATSATNQPFKPERSRQREIGIKHQSSRLSGSLALFHILFENATTSDPNNPGFEIQSGEQRAKGVELEAAWQVTPQWYLSGGAAYIDAEITKSNDGDVGNDLGNVAHFQANLWSRYHFTPALAVGVGVYHVGRRQGTLSNTYELPAYTTVDASLSWDIERRVSAEVLARNLFDKVYYTGNNNFSVYPGEPRSVLARLIFRF
ncbi:MAG: TonB-dependent siderophore receptor [Methylophilaceae bacterium]|nr:TonB-dependent siderophore receptor [Methylophilaceae bacterium]